MSLPDRKEDEVRRMLEAAPHPIVPPGLAALAARQGHRMLRRRRVLRTAGWWLLFAAAVAFSVWAALAEPWTTPPIDTTPPVEGW
ncbi:hypothetical protein ACQUSR_11800 [Streptomyces sp. P1-3]|uniref:hypothetical protein n=1 Tax=Streptomyces sp. P1-3 TaxID=3421658 RepID=UPI003D36E277